MLKFLGLEKPLLLLSRRLLYGWVRAEVLPQYLDTLGIDRSRPVVYVLQRRFLSNILVLSRETERLGLPDALAPLATAAGREPRSFFFLNRAESWFGRRKPPGNSPLLMRLTEATRASPDLDVQLIPVVVLWGRAPGKDDKESSIWKLIFAESWAPRGFFTQFFTILLHGRKTMLKLGQPLSLRELVQDAEDSERALRKVSRVLRVYFRHQREAAIGPDYSHRRTQVEEILEAPGVKAAIDGETASTGAVAVLKAQRQARAYAWEIAADYSYVVIRVLDRFLHWLWNRLYDGVEVNHLETLTSLAADNEIIYVPCHRSHIDYLLMSYLVFNQGLMVPHIAAGANLNLPIVGNILRRSGAFFLRRSFKGNEIYGAVFNEYLHMMIAKGFPIEYFVEGGRSRTGRLLAPKAGMLAMTVQSYLRESSRPIVFLPVYIGYEKLFEGRSYVGELMGKPKKKESLWDLLGTVGELKKNFGKVHVNIGEPIRLAELLQQENPQWKSEPLQPDAKPQWFTSTINALMRRIADNLNSAAVANPVNLASLAILATPRNAMDAVQLVRQIDGYRTLLMLAPYAERSVVTTLDGAAIVAYCERLKWLQRQPHALGDVIHAYPEDAVLLSYQRNNVLHCFALPALVACLLSHNGSLSREQLLGLTRTVYPFLREELFLRWDDAQLEDSINTYLAALTQMGWLANRGREGVYYAPNFNTDEYAQLMLLGQAVRPTLIRYFITLSVLTQQGPGKVAPQELEALCHLLAQRLSLLREFSAPEFFDRAIFRTFINTLKTRGLASLDAAGKLEFHSSLREAAAEAHYVLPADVRQSVLHLTRIEPRVVSQALEKLAAKT